MWPVCPTQVPPQLPVGRPWIPAPCPQGKGPRPKPSRPPMGSAPCLSGPRALLDVGGEQGRRGQRLSQRGREKGETEREKETEEGLRSAEGTREGKKSRLGNRYRDGPKEKGRDEKLRGPWPFGVQIPGPPKLRPGRPVPAGLPQLH